MSTEQTLVAKYMKKGRLLGGELLLGHEGALEFIEDCKELGLTILGMDFYIEKHGDLIELVGASADYSSLKTLLDTAEKSTSAAKALIRDGLPDRASWVSFVVEE